MLRLPCHCSPGFTHCATRQLFCWGDIFFRCANEKVPDEYGIRGDLENLPAGSVVLETPFPAEGKTLDSVEVRGGKFEFRIPIARYPESIRVAIAHYDANGIKRPIFLPTGTNGKAGHGGESTQEFFLEDGITMNGPVKLYKTGQWSSFHADQVIQVGKQTRVMYGDTAGFEVINNLNTLKTLVSTTIKRIGKKP